ncbi:MAG: hypothetical protein ACH34X_18315 [Thiolinea sp.]
MGIPKQVTEQLEAAEDMVKALQMEDAPIATETDDESVDVDIEAFEAPEPDDETPTESQPETAHGTEETKSSDDAGYWKQQAKMHEGRVKAQGQKLSQLRQQLTQMQAGISQQVESALDARLQRQREEAEKTAKMQATRRKLAEQHGLDEEGISALDEYIQLQQPRTPEPKPPLTPPPDLAFENYRQTVFDAVPQFSELNSQPGFNQWLDAADSDGISRREKIRSAHENLQAGRVVGIVTRYLSEAAQVESEEAKRQAAIQRQASPSRSRVGSPPQAPQQFLTPQQINTYYERWNRGEYRGKSDQWAKIEKLIATSERHLMGQ